MTTTLRGILFGCAVAAALTVTLDNVTAAESPEVFRLDAVEVTAHRDAFDAHDELDKGGSPGAGRRDRAQGRPVSIAGGNGRRGHGRPERRGRR